VGTAEQNDDLLRCLEYTDEYAFGATIPIVVALFETSLASKITSSATSMTLVKGSDKAGNDLSGHMCFIIDEGTASEEFVCGTASSTAISSMTRGLDPQDGKTEITALKEAHRRGASVKVTNFPQLGILSRIMNGDEDFPNIIQYESQPTFSTDEDIITKKYADDLAISGAPDATRTVKGIVEIATLEEMRSGTSTGGTTAKLVAEAKWFATTSAGTSSLLMTDTDGKLDQSFIDLTETFSYTASTSMESASTTNLTAREATISGTSSLATTTINGVDLDVVLGGSNSDASAYHTHGTLDYFSTSSLFTITDASGISTSTSIEITSNGSQRIVVNYDSSIYLSAVTLSGANPFLITGSIDGATAATSSGTCYNTGNTTHGFGGGSLNFISDVLTSGSHTLYISMPNIVAAGNAFVYYSISVHTIN